MITDTQIHDDYDIEVRDTIISLAISNIEHRADRAVTLLGLTEAVAAK